MSRRQTVFIGFADALSAPEVAWSLVDAGFRVVAFARRGVPAALRRSALVEVVEVADPGVAARVALDDLAHAVGELDAPVVMPLDDASVWLVDQLSRIASLRVAGATERRATIALDKELQVEHARRADLWVPPTDVIRNERDLREWSRFPAIVKPALAARVVAGRLSRSRAHFIANAAERDKLASSLALEEPYLVQPVIRGVGEGVFGLAHRDRITHFSGHRRVRMMNPSGSGSSACEPRPPDAEVRQRVTRFLRECGWEGLFMVELLRDEAGTTWFMELNGRPWGSMALARRQGFEYPAWAVQQLLDEKYEPPAPPTEAPVICRHLGRELLHLAFVMRGSPAQASVPWPPRTRALRDVLQVRGDHAFYNWRSDDPAVFWADAQQTLVGQLRKSGGVPLATKIARRVARLQVRREQARHRQIGTLQTPVARAGSVLFLCYGNINRSALAEVCLRKLLPRFENIASCGFHSPEGRPADEQMRKLARARGIDLENWSSTTLRRSLLSSAGLILAMEAAHLVRLSEEFPDVTGRAFLLGAVTTDAMVPLEIADPFGKSEAAYARCMTEVTRAVEHLASLMQPEATGKRA